TASSLFLSYFFIFCVRFFIKAVPSLDVSAILSFKLSPSCFKLSSISFHSQLCCLIRPRRSLPEEGVLNNVTVALKAPPTIIPNTSDFPLDIIHTLLFTCLLYLFLRQL